MHAARYFLFVPWTLELSALAWPTDTLAVATTASMFLYICLVAFTLRRQTLILFIVLGATAAALAGAFDLWQAANEGLASASVFAAFFGTILVLRATADLRPETAAARSLFGDLTPRQRSGGLLIGAHVIGAVLVVGVMAILAPIHGAASSDKVRQKAAEVCVRGMGLAALWSPFWVAMVVISELLPTVALWQVMSLGIPLAVVGLIVAQLMYAPGSGFGELWKALRGLSPILPSVIVCASAVTCLTTFTGLSTLQSLILAVPALCGMMLVTQGRGALMSACRTTWKTTGSVTDEIVVLTIALVLGRIVEQAALVSGGSALLAEFALPPVALIAAIVATITLLSIIGVHQIVSVTVILSLLAPLPTGLTDLVLMETALVSWTFASTVGVAAISVAVASAVFRVPREHLMLGPNLWFVLVFGIIAVAVLGGVNAVLS